MRIDIPATDSWLLTNDRFRQALSATEKSFADDGVQIQTYAGYTHAIYEATQGLARLFSHKKTVAFVSPAEPAIEQLAIAFSEEAYTVKMLKPADLEDAATTLAPLMTDLVFVIYAVDDPVTGRLFDLAKIDAALKDKRVFRIALSHAAHRFVPLTRPMPFEVRVSSLDPEIALITAGERFRVSPALAPRLPWSPELNVAHLASEFSSQAASETERRKKQIEEFEASLPPGFKAYFESGASRLFDRAVIYCEEMDGSAVIDLLAEKIGAPIGRAGDSSPLEATSACRWSNSKMTDWLRASGMSSAVQRGLIVISASLMSDRLKSALCETAAEIRKLQNG